MDNNYNFPVKLQPIYLSNRKKIPNRKAVVRTDTMSTLGIVSDDYGLVKHGTVIDSFREAGKKYNVKEKITLTKEGAHLFYQMTFPKVQVEVKQGDIVRMMMIAKNSYNGSNRLQVIFGAFRLVCSNGMILGTQFLQFSFRHIGNVGGINDEAMIEQYQDAYKNYIHLFGERSPMIAEMAKRPVPIGFTDGLFDKDFVALPQYLLDEARLSYKEGNDSSVWGYYNALTYAVTHKSKTSNPDLAISHGVEAWKAAERVFV